LAYTLSFVFTTPTSPNILRLSCNFGFSSCNNLNGLLKLNFLE
jgi:hypothetical protein